MIEYSAAEDPNVLLSELSLDTPKTSNSPQMPFELSSSLLIVSSIAPITSITVIAWGDRSDYCLARLVNTTIDLKENVHTVEVAMRPRNKRTDGQQNTLPRL